MIKCLSPGNTRAGSNSNRRDINKYYKIGIKLGAGAFGQVRDAKHFSTNQMRAVKIIFKHEKGVTLDKIMREIELMRMMDNRYVVRLHDFFQDNKFLYAVMDKFRGKELVEKLTWKDLREKHSAAYVKMMLLSVLYISTKVKVVHRDIKPENFIFKTPDPFGDLVMIDFGLSDTIRDGEYLNTCCGTVNFLAPELIIGKYRFEVDLWGVGIVAYLLLFGRFPFSGEGDSAIVKEIVNKELEFTMSKTKKDSVRTVSSESKDLVRQMLQKNPKDRITVRDALDHVWINPDAKGKRRPFAQQSSHPRRQGTSSPSSGRRPDTSHGKRPDTSHGKRPDASHGKRPSTSHGKRPDASDARRPDSNGRRPDSNGRRPDSNGRRPDSNNRRPDSNGRRPDSNGRRPGASKSRAGKSRRPRPSRGRRPRASHARQSDDSSSSSSSSERDTSYKARRKTDTNKKFGRRRSQKRPASKSPRSPRHRKKSPQSKGRPKKPDRKPGRKVEDTKLLFNT